MNLYTEIAHEIVSNEFTRLAEDMHNLLQKIGVQAVQYDGNIYHTKQRGTHYYTHCHWHTIQYILKHKLFQPTPLKYMEEVDEIHNRTNKIHSDIESIKKMLVILWYRIQVDHPEGDDKFQRMRDALPEIIVPEFTKVVGKEYKRKKPELFPILTNPLKLKQVNDLIPTISLYVMSRYIH